MVKQWLRRLIVWATDGGEPSAAVVPPQAPLILSEWLHGPAPRQTEEEE